MTRRFWGRQPLIRWTRSILPPLALLILLVGPLSMAIGSAQSSLASTHVATSPGLWSNLTASTGTGPSSRNGSAAAYDPVDREVVVFGGLSTAGAVLGDTWLFHSGVWSRATLGGHHTPRPRAFGTMVWDAVDRHVVMFGGVSQWPATNGAKLNDTWYFRGGIWKPITTAVAPLPRFEASMAYDAHDRYVLLFGGNTTSGPYGDTWTFAHGNWTRLKISGPSPRDGAAMGFDRQNLDVVLTNGRGLPTFGSPYKNDTWIFSAGQWTQKIQPNFFLKPIHRFGAGLASSPARGTNQTLVIGGSLNTSTGPKETYMYAWGGSRYSFPMWAPRMYDTTQFPIFVWDGADGYLLYVTGGYTWRYG
jgi:hypothetical protein